MTNALELILASSSPRRRELLTAAGYQFRVVPPHELAECGVCSGETPPEMVARLAYQKDDLVIGADVGMVECRRGLRFTQEVVFAEMFQHVRGQYLDRHISARRCPRQTLRASGTWLSTFFSSRRFATPSGSADSSEWI